MTFVSLMLWRVVRLTQDRALPIAAKSGAASSRLRLCNKLTEVMLNLQLYGEAVEFAYIALDISITLGRKGGKSLHFRWIDHIFRVGLKRNLGYGAF